MSASVSPKGTAGTSNLREVREVAFGIASLFAVLSILTELQPVYRRPHPVMLLLFAIGTVGPFAGAAFALEGRRRTRVLGFLSGLAVMTAIVAVLASLGFVIGAPLAILSFTAGFLYMLMVPLMPVVSAAQEVYHRMPAAGYPILLVVFVGCFLLRSRVRAALAQLAPADRTTATGFGMGRWMAIAYAVLGVPLYMSMSAALFMHQMKVGKMKSDRAAEDIVQTRVAMRNVQACLLGYASTHPTEGFPRTLPVLEAQGAGCAGTTQGIGVARGWQLRYAAGWPDASGRVSRFWIVTQATDPDEPANEIFYATEQGMMFETRDDNRGYRLSTGGGIIIAPVPPPESQRLAVDDSPAHTMLSIRDCITRRQSDYHVPPPAAVDTTPCAHEILTKFRRDSLIVEVMSMYQSRITGEYVLSYERNGDGSAGSPWTFTLSARPLRYGVDGIRSYFLDASGIVHWTRDDRAATTTDEATRACEIQSSGCAVAELQAMR